MQGNKKLIVYIVTYRPKSQLSIVNKKLIVYIITYGPKRTRSLLGNYSPLKDIPRKISKKNSAPGKYTTS